MRTFRVRVARAWRVLDEDDVCAGGNRARHLFEVPADHDDRRRSGHHQPLERAERADQEPRPAEHEVRQLLGQARVHVVQMRHAQQPGEQQTNRPALFVRMHVVEAPLEADVKGLESQQQVQRHLGKRWSDSHAPHKWRPPAPVHLQAAQRHVPPEGIRHEIHRVAEVGQRPDPMVFAERRAPGLEERFGGDHEDAHGSVRSPAPACASTWPINAL
jgi:hypothetical protein